MKNKSCFWRYIICSLNPNFAVVIVMKWKNAINTGVWADILDESIMNYVEIKISSKRLSLQHFFLVIDFNCKIWVKVMGDFHIAIMQYCNIAILRYLNSNSQIFILIFLQYYLTFFKLKSINIIVLILKLLFHLKNESSRFQQSLHL